MQAVLERSERVEQNDSFMQAFGCLQRKDKRRERRLRKGYKYD